MQPCNQDRFLSGFLQCELLSIVVNFKRKLFTIGEYCGGGLISAHRSFQINHHPYWLYRHKHSYNHSHNRPLHVEYHSK